MIAIVGSLLIIACCVATWRIARTRPSCDHDFYSHTIELTPWVSGTDLLYPSQTFRTCHKCGLKYRETRYYTSPLRRKFNLTSDGTPEATRELQ